MLSVGGSFQCPVIRTSPREMLPRGILAQPVNQKGSLTTPIKTVSPLSPAPLARAMSCEPSEPAPRPSTGYWAKSSTNLIQKDVRSLFNQQIGSLRVELSRMCFDLVSDLEARLTDQIGDAKSKTDASVQALSLDMRGAIQELSERMKSTTEEQLEVVAANVSEANEETAEPESQSSNGSSIFYDKSSLPLTADMVTKISDHVITRVNADPRVCQLVESHQSLQESFSKLLVLLERGPSPTKQVSKKPETDIELMMLEVQKCCKSIALEVRQLRQRCNQDGSETMLRFEELEKKQRVMEDVLMIDVNKGMHVEAFESKGASGNSHNIQRINEDSFDEETEETEVQ